MPTCRTTHVSELATPADRQQQAHHVWTTAEESGNGISTGKEAIGHPRTTAMLSQCLQDQQCLASMATYWQEGASGQAYTHQLVQLDVAG